MGKRHKSSRVKGHCWMCGREQGNGQGNNSNWKHWRKLGVKRRYQQALRRMKEDAT